MSTALVHAAFDFGEKGTRAALGMTDRKARLIASVAMAANPLPFFCSE
jgi:hypothetical protein